MKLAARLTATIAVLGVAMLATAGAALAWAPEGSATIHPGVMTFTGGSSFVNGAGQCTANFVFTDASGNTYLGQAAHCSSTGGDTSTDGCTTKSLPLGTPIYAGDAVNGGLQDGTKIGTLAYNSWIAMQNAKETDANTCAYNDLALIKIDPSQVANVNPTVPFWGGPDGLAPAAAAQGSQVFTYGNSILRGGVSALSPKTGASLGDVEGTGGWSEDVYTVSPGIPGDSGSAYMDSNGDALGDRPVGSAGGRQRRRHAGQGTRLRQQRDRPRPDGRQGHHAVQLGPGSAGVLSKPPAVSRAPHQPRRSLRRGGMERSA